MWFSDDSNWMQEKFGGLSDSAFPQKYAPIQGEFYPFLHLGKVSKITGDVVC